MEQRDTKSEGGMAAPASILSDAELGALMTASTALDNEVERLLRLLGARDELQKLTDKVRLLVQALAPLHQRQAALHQAIAEQEATLAALKEATAEAEHKHVGRTAGLAWSARAAPAEAPCKRMKGHGSPWPRKQEALVV